MTIKKPDDWEHWEFDNAKLRKSFPRDLIPEKAEGNEDFLGCLLTLTMIFNDFKGLVQLNDTISQVYKSEPPAIDEHFGEKSGVQMQMVKLLYATVNEALIFIRDSSTILDSDRFKRLVQRTSDNNQVVWQMLRKIADQEPIDDERFARYAELRDFLVKARNNVGFHYQTRRQLIEGYRRFFFQGIANVPEEAREYAFRSTAREFKDSRYYYVDAALQGYYVNLFGDEKSAQQRNQETFELVNLIVYAIHDILREYISDLPNR